MVLEFLGVVTIVSLLDLFAALAYGMPQPPFLLLLNHVGKGELAGGNEIESEVDEGVHNTLYGLDGLFVAVGTGFIVIEADFSFLFVGEDEGFVGPIEEIHQVLLVERQGHLLLLIMLLFMTMVNRSKYRSEGFHHF